MVVLQLLNNNVRLNFGLKIPNTRTENSISFAKDDISNLSDNELDAINKFALKQYIEITIDNEKVLCISKSVVEQMENPMDITPVEDIVDEVVEDIVEAAPVESTYTMGNSSSYGDSEYEDSEESVFEYNEDDE